MLWNMVALKPRGPRERRRQEFFQRRPKRGCLMDVCVEVTILELS